MKSSCDRVAIWTFGSFHFALFSLFPLNNRNFNLHVVVISSRSIRSCVSAREGMNYLQSARLCREIGKFLSQETSSWSAWKIYDWFSDRKNVLTHLSGHYRRHFIVQRVMYDIKLLNDSIFQVLECLYCGLTLSTSIVALFTTVEKSYAIQCVWSPGNKQTRRIS